MSILDLITQLENRTDHWFEFDVSDEGKCPLRDLSPGGTQNIKQARIIQSCRDRGSHHDWTIHVLIKNELTGMYLCPKQHLLQCTKIVFEYDEPNAQGLQVLVMRGSWEKTVDYVLRLKRIGNVFGRDTKWNKRPLDQIQQADPRWNRNLREIEDGGNNVEASVLRVDNTIPMRQAAASPARRNRGGNSSSTHYSAADQEISYDIHADARILLLLLSFSFFAFLRFFIIW